MVHIGDNFYSDYKIPIEKGITALYYPSIWTKVLGKASWWRKAFPYDNFSEDPYIRLLYSFTFLRAYNHGYVLQEDRCFKNIKDFAQMFLTTKIFRMNISKFYFLLEMGIFRYRFIIYSRKI